MYTAGATNIDNGLQQVNIHSYQELTSLNANKLLLGLFEHGVYNTEVSISTVGNDVLFTIKKGSTFFFEKEFESQPLVAKIILQDDAVLTISKTSLNSFISASSLILFGTWNYNLAINTANKFINFQILPYSEPNLGDIENEKDLIVAIILDHTGYLGDNSNASLYKPAYQNQKYRNVMKNLFKQMSNFPITFIQNGTAITINVGKGNCILGDTYIHNMNTLSANVANSIWPVPIATGSPASFNQIDVLRLKTERNESNSNIPYLKWESFLKPTGVYTSIEEYIDGFDFTFEDLGYSLLFCVRPRVNLNSNTNIWPSQCLIVDPSIPQIGIPETFSRFKIPVY
jgi:hypothetical protein